MRRTTDEIYKKRLEKNKLRLASNICNNRENKENEKPISKQNTNNTLVVTERKQESIQHMKNPFNLPAHLRLFSSRKKDKKTDTKVPFITNELKTICEIDHTFYKMIEGRPLRQFSDVKVYMRDIRDITLFRANTAYLRDQIIQIDTAFQDEYTEYEKVFELFLKTKSNFARFAQECYQIGKIMENMANAKSKELDKMVDQLDSYSFTSVRLRNQLTGLIASFENVDKYRKFLFSLSPAPWIKTFSPHFIENIVDVIGLQENLTSGGPIHEFKESLVRLQKVKPELFFNEPIELITIFDDISKQCLHYMEINIFATKIISDVVKYRAHHKKTIQEEVAELSEYVDIFERNITWMEQKEVENKTLFERILLNEFHELFASYDACKLFTCVQYVNTRLFETAEDPKDDLLLLTSQFELQYCDLTSKLDCLDQEVVKASTNELFAEDIKMMKMAYKAQRELKECDLLSKALYTSFEPPRNKRK